MSDVLIRLEIDKAALGDARDAAAVANVDLQVPPQPQFIEPITAVLVAGGVLAVAKFLVDLADRWKGGVVIDLSQGSSPVIRRDKEVPFGWAVVIAQGGTVHIDVHDAPKDTTERLLSQIIEGVFKSAKDVAEAAKKTLGSSKVKETGA